MPTEALTVAAPPLPIESARLSRPHQGSVRYIGGQVKRMVTEALSAWRLRRLLAGGCAPASARVWTMPATAGRYLVSSDRGVFEFTAGKLRRLLPFPTFGISIEGGMFYAACHIGPFSHIVSARIADDGASLRLSGFRCLLSEETRYDNERIHQIHVRAGIVAVANTKTNSILLLDAKSGVVIRDIYPFADATGFPVKADHNHINSVYQAGPVTFFTAHSAGALGSFLGYVHDGRTVAFQYAHRGIHDLIPSSGGMIFCDTFGATGAAGGSLIIGGHAIESLSQRRHMLRGIAGAGPEIVVGHSNFGSREDRFLRNGRLIVLRDKEIAAVADVPFAQVYDIVRTDGRKLDTEIQTVLPDDARSMLSAALGTPVYERDYHVLLPDEKRFELGISAAA